MTAVTRPPLIETPRLILRPHRLEDYPQSAAMWADPSVVRHITGTPSTPQQSWMRVLHYAGHWQLMGFGYWAIEERAGGRFIGEAGFADFKRNLVPALSNLPEAGWALMGEVHGRGFGTEAVAAALAWSDAHLRRPQIVCLISPENAASIRVAAKCGFRNPRPLDVNGNPTLVFLREPGEPGALRRGV